MNWVLADVRPIEPWTFEGPEDAMTAFNNFADAIIESGKARPEARQFMLDAWKEEYDRTKQLMPNSPWTVLSQAVEKFGEPVTNKQIMQDAPIKGQGSKWIL